MKPDHRSTLLRLFKASLDRHEIKKSCLENDELKHVFKLNYRHSRLIFGIGGELYCGDLWKIIESPSFKDYPIFQYNVAHSINLPDDITILSQELDTRELEKYFDTIVTDGISPKIKAMQTPKQCVEYALHNQIVLGLGAAKAAEYLSKWCNYFKIDYK